MGNLGRNWKHLPEVITADGDEHGYGPVTDEFGMSVPTYLRMDLVDRETREAYELGVEEGERQAMARWGMQLPDSTLPGRKKRVMGV